MRKTELHNRPVDINRLEVSVALPYPNYHQKVKAQTSGVNLSSFWRFIKAKPKVRGASNYKVASAIIPALFGLISALSIPLTNLARDHRINYTQSKKSLISAVGKVFPVSFSILMANNLLQAFILASPARIVGYLPLFFFSLWNARNEFKLIDNANDIRELRQKILNHRYSSKEELDRLMSQLSQTFEQGQQLSGNLGMFGRLIYTLMLIPSFAANLSLFSISTKYGRNGEYKPEFLSGYTLNHHLCGYQGKPGLWKALKQNGRKEYEVLKKGIEYLLKPTLWEKTLGGNNHQVEAEIIKKNCGKLQKTIYRLTGGFHPSGAALVNMFLRIVGFSATALAFTTIGREFFNRKTPYDILSDTQEKKIDSSLVVKASDLSIFLGRWVTGYSTIIGGLNPQQISTFGPLTSGGNILGGLFYVASGLASLFGFNGLENSLQYAGSGSLFFANGVQSMFQNIKDFEHKRPNNISKH